MSKLLDFLFGNTFQRDKDLLELEIKAERLLYREALLARPCNSHECEHHKQNITNLGSKYLKLTGKPYQIEIREYELMRVMESRVR